MSNMLKKLDKNGDGKITIEDIDLILQGLGLASVSPRKLSTVRLEHLVNGANVTLSRCSSTDISKALFKAVDRNQNGQLDLTDVMALAAIVSKLNSRFGSGVNQQA
jgi:hypothetical protein